MHVSETTIHCTDCTADLAISTNNGDEPIICDCGNLIFPSDYNLIEQGYITTFYPVGFSLN